MPRIFFIFTYLYVATPENSRVYWQYLQMNQICYAECKNDQRSMSVHTCACVDWLIAFRGYFDMLLYLSR